MGLRRDKHVQWSAPTPSLLGTQKRRTRIPVFFAILASVLVGSLVALAAFKPSNASAGISFPVYLCHNYPGAADRDDLTLSSYSTTRNGGAFPYGGYDFVPEDHCSDGGFYMRWKPYNLTDIRPNVDFGTSVTTANQDRLYFVSYTSSWAGLYCAFGENDVFALFYNDDPPYSDPPYANPPNGWPFGMPDPRRNPGYPGRYWLCKWRSSWTNPDITPLRLNFYVTSRYRAIKYGGSYSAIPRNVMCGQDPWTINNTADPFPWTNSGSLLPFYYHELVNNPNGQDSCLYYASKSSSDNSPLGFTPGLYEYVGNPGNPSDPTTNFFWVVHLNRCNNDQQNNCYLGSYGYFSSIGAISLQEYDRIDPNRAPGIYGGTFRDLGINQGLWLRGVHTGVLAGGQDQDAGATIYGLWLTPVGNALGSPRSEGGTDVPCVGRIPGGAGWSRLRPCPTDGGTLTVSTNTARVPDGTWGLYGVVLDPSLNGTTAGYGNVKVDNTAPTAPTNLTANTTAWVNTNNFNLSWTNPSQGGNAPITAARYLMCRTQPNDPGCSSPTVGSASGYNIQQLNNVSVPGPGEWQVALWLRDDARDANNQPGNENFDNTATIRLRYDPTSPESATISGPTPTQNGFVRGTIQVSGSASDSVSGISAARGSGIYYRVGSGAWQLCAGLPDANPYNATVSATCTLNTTNFADGSQLSFELRAYDQAGNLTTRSLPGPYTVDNAPPQLTGSVKAFALAPRAAYLHTSLGSGRLDARTNINSPSASALAASEWTNASQVRFDWGGAFTDNLSTANQLTYTAQFSMSDQSGNPTPGSCFVQSAGPSNQTTFDVTEQRGTQCYQGAQVLRLTITDLAGNTITTYTYIRYDSHPTPESLAAGWGENFKPQGAMISPTTYSLNPTFNITWTNPTYNSTTQSPIVSAWVAQDDNDNNPTPYSTCPGSGQTCSISYTLSPITPGEHTLHLYLEDAAGNLDRSQAVPFQARYADNACVIP